MKKLFLLDAYALIYRAYFALNKNPRINSKGLNTSAIMGFLNTLYEVLKNEKPTHIGVAFDLGEPIRRTENFAEYKANREETPPDIKISVPYIKEIIKAFNIPIFEKAGYEADDIIGTLSKKAEKEGFTTYMMTPDKDFGQLVSENIFIYKPAKSGEPAKVLGVKEVCEKFGISRPEQVIDILGLWGDASDNIPGIPGIGEKTASKLIAEYDSVENIIANADKLKGKMRENVINNAHKGIMSKQLATIDINVPIDFNEELLSVKEPNYQYLTELCEELEFRTFMSRFNNSYQRSAVSSQQSVVSSQQSVVSSRQSVVSSQLSVETHGRASVSSQLDLFGDLDNEPQIIIENRIEPILIKDEKQISELVEILRKVNSFVFHIDEKEILFSTNPNDIYKLPASTSLSIFNDIFSDENKILIDHNIKSDVAILSKSGIEIKNKLWDVMIAHYLIEPELNHGLEYLTDIYADGNSEIRWQLYEKFKSMLSENNLEKLFYDIEMPLVKVLAKMESNGVRIDIEGLKQISDEQEKDIKAIENEIFDIAGTSFNIASPKQLGEILFERLNIKAPKKKTKTGQYPTGEDVLQKIIDENPIVQLILDYRSLTKLKSTYVDALPSLVSRTDGLIHTSFNQAVTATGRLSSNNPNLQNIPVRTEKGREIRKAFVPRDENHILLAADYSQIELRIIAHLSGDQVMQKAFREGLDIHADTASRVYNVALEDVTSEMRRNAKAVNFGIIYGMSAFGLAERLKISRTEASQIIKNYFKEYVGIQEYIDKQVNFAKDYGYVETMLGRRRYLRDINSGNSVVRNFAERNAINAPIQGSSADMIKIAMINIDKEMTSRNLKSKMILQVHDELVFDVCKDELDVLQEIIKEKMLNALPLSIPIEVNLNTGENWLEAH